MIAIIGNGNVGSHLYLALKGKTQVKLINPHTLEGLPENPEVIIICVTDDTIREVAKKLPPSTAIIAHTSGSVPLSALDFLDNPTGVFYPLQTFTKGVKLDYSEIPVFIEGSNENTANELKKIASLFSLDVREADSEARRQLHLASVFACNFTNALAGIAKDLLHESGTDFSALFPLMKQTVNKLAFKSPKEAQTGPAARGDFKVIEKHLEMLNRRPDLQEIYSSLSKIISNNK